MELFPILIVCCSMLFEPTLGGSQCSDGLIPGVEKMARGIDITELDLFSTDLQQTNGFRNTIIDLTYDSGRKWKHPSDSTEYNLPDQVAGIKANPAAALESNTAIITDYDDYKDWRLVKVGLQADKDSYGSFSSSVGLKEVQESLYKSNRIIAEVSRIDIT